MKTVDISQKIRDARIEARLSQRELAKALGVSDKSISAYEKGRAVPPLTKIQRLSEVTHLPVSYFTDQKEDKAALQKRLNDLERELQSIKRRLKSS